MTDDTYSTTDEELIKFLIARKSKIVKTEKNARNRTIFTFSKSEIEPFLQEWLSGEEIMIEIRNIFQATKIFNMRIHDGQ